MSKVTIRVATPVKVMSGILTPGPHDVEAAVAEELAALGVLETDDMAEAAPEVLTSQLLPVSQDEIDQLVAARAQAIAEEIVDAAVSTAMVGLVAERDAAIARAADAETRLAEIEAAKGTGEAADNIPSAAAPQAAASKKPAATKG